MFLCTALGLATFVAASAHPSSGAVPAARLAPADTGALASRLSGTWSGNRVDSGSAKGHPFTMTWKQAPDGEMTGRVALAHGPAYTTRVVWSSDTAFITESAPHKSPELKESVVTRTVTHFKGDSLVGQYELRPTSFTGHTLTGHFAAARTS
jgi:hypothetical protein